MKYRSFVIVICLFVVFWLFYFFYEYSHVKDMTLSATTQSVPVCGNKIVEWAEECDGHKRSELIYCNEDCTLMLIP